MGAKKVLVFDNNRTFLNDFPSAETLAEFWGINKNKIYHAMRKYKYGQSKIPMINGKYVVYEKDFPDYTLPAHGDIRSSFSVGKKKDLEAVNLEDLKGVSKEEKRETIIELRDRLYDVLDKIEEYLED